MRLEAESAFIWKFTSLLFSPSSVIVAPEMATTEIPVGVISSVTATSAELGSPTVYFAASCSIVRVTTPSGSKFPLATLAFK